MSPPRSPCCCRLFDCDFNQQLDLGLRNEQHRTVFDIDSLEELTGENTYFCSSNLLACTVFGSGPLAWLCRILLLGVLQQA